MLRANLLEFHAAAPTRMFLFQVLLPRFLPSYVIFIYNYTLNLEYAHDYSGAYTYTKDYNTISILQPVCSNST